MTKEWRPLPKGMRHGIITAMTHDGKQVMDLQSTTVFLPDGIALCELVEVEPEAITPEALEREGWERYLENGSIYRLGCNGGESYIYATSTPVGSAWDPTYEWRVSLGSYEWSSLYELPYCDSMQKLRALVEMLGGGQ